MELNGFNLISVVIGSLIAFFLGRLAFQIARVFWKARNGKPSLHFTPLPDDATLPDPLIAAESALKALGFARARGKVAHIAGETAPLPVLTYIHPEHPVVAMAQLAQNSAAGYAVDFTTLFADGALVGTKFPYLAFVDAPLVVLRYAGTSLTAAYEYQLSAVETWAKTHGGALVPGDLDDFEAKETAALAPHRAQIDNLALRSGRGTLVRFGAGAVAGLVFGWFPILTVLTAQGKPDFDAFSRIFAWAMLVLIAVAIAGYVYSNRALKSAPPVDAAQASTTKSRP